MNLTTVSNPHRLRGRPRTVDGDRWRRFRCSEDRFRI